MRQKGPMPKAILFDLDDTLLIDDPATHATFEAVAATAGDGWPGLAEVAMGKCVELWKAGEMYPFCRSIGIHGYECVWGNFAGADPQYERLAAWVPGFRSAIWEQSLAETGAADRDLAQRLAELYPQERRGRLNLMPDALEVVRGLREKYPVALLTNGAPSLQREKIAACALESEFDAITISGELGIGKPKPEIFLATAEKLGVAVTDCVMVGNSLERDIAGGNGVGMPTVHIVVPGAREEGTARPTASIHALRELPGVLAEIGRMGPIGPI